LEVTNESLTLSSQKKVSLEIDERYRRVPGGKKREGVKFFEIMK
jgi:hypothetical protein